MAFSHTKQCPNCDKDAIFVINLPLTPDLDGVTRWHIAGDCVCGWQWEALCIEPIIRRDGIEPSDSAIGGRLTK